MSKNAFDEIYNQFKEQEDDIERILQIMVMYDEPIDKYSLMVLSHTAVSYTHLVEYGRKLLHLRKRDILRLSGGVVING